MQQRVFLPAVIQTNTLSLLRKHHKNVCVSADLSVAYALNETLGTFPNNPTGVSFNSAHSIENHPAFPDQRGCQAHNGLSRLSTFWLRYYCISKSTSPNTYASAGYNYPRLGLAEGRSSPGSMLAANFYQTTTNRIGLTTKVSCVYSPRGSLEIL